MTNAAAPWLRPLSVWFIPLAVLVALVLPAAFLLPRLPDPVAVHWGLSGDPNGSLPIWLWLAGAWVLWLGHCLYLVISDRANPAGPSLRSPYSTAGVLLGLEVVILRANLDASTWQQADSNVVIDLGLIALFAIAFWRGGRFLEPQRGPTGEQRPEPVRPRLGLGTTERAMWVGGARMTWWALALVGGAAVLSLLFGFLPVSLLAKTVTWFVAVAVAGAVITYSYVSVQISSVEVVVKPGPWGRARRIALDSVREAQVIDVDPRRFGGWGHRTFPGGSGFIMRGGEGLLLRRQDANDLLITVDDAATAAGLVNDLIARSGENAPRSRGSDAWRP